jgi:hypothetical protein
MKQRKRKSGRTREGRIAEEVKERRRRDGGEVTAK